jgi:hypothetical protein
LTIADDAGIERGEMLSLMAIAEISAHIMLPIKKPGISLVFLLVD